MNQPDDERVLANSTEYSDILPQDRLDAYAVSREVRVAAAELIDSLPRGQGKLVDQLRRASTNLPLLIAEGANRRSPAQKRQRFEEAMGEAGEIAAAADQALDLDIGDQDAASRLRHLCGRVGAMVYRLEEKFRAKKG